MFYWVVFKCGCIKKGSKRFFEKVCEKYNDNVEKKIIINYDSYDIEIVFINEQCNSCIIFDKFKNSHKPNSTIQNRTYYHGLDAGFFRSCCLENIKDNLINIEMFKNIEIAATCDKMYGNIGVKIKGEVLIASNIDLSSVYNDSGKRIFRIDDTKINEIFIDVSDDKHNMYQEYIIKNCNIEAICIKDKFLESQENKDFIKKLSEKYPIEYVA